MRRLTRILGVIGGIGAIIWAMRGRLISVAIPREPQPPAFQAPPREASPRGHARSGEAGGGETAGRQERAETKMVTDVHGIGPVYATRLEASGVTTLSDLAGSDPEKIAEAAGVASSRAQGWVNAAGAILGR